MPDKTKRLERWAELLILLLGVPLLLWLVLPPKAIIPVVWTMAVLCHHLSSRIEASHPRVWWNVAAVTRAELKRMLLRFIPCALLLYGLTRYFHPEMLFSFVLTMPVFWAVVMVLYPILSVVPQEIIFRRYIYVRFAGILTPMGLWLVSGLGFGFAHIALDNWVAPALCAIGGLMFAQTYARTRSLALVSLEHALYGDMVFTLGLGRYFYHGAVGH